MKYINIVVVVGFVIALIIHSQQTEATYRLDFVWKLQATGVKYCIIKYMPLPRLQN